MDSKTIALIRKAIPADKLGEVDDTLMEVEQYIKTAIANESKLEDLQNQLDQVTGEKVVAERDMMKYKAIQKKATEQLTEMEAEIQKANEKIKAYDEIKAENENLKTLKVERDNAIRDEYQKRIEEYSKKEAFEKVKGKIVLPSEEKKLTDLTIEEITASNAKLDEAVEYGLFGSTPTKTPKDAGNEETVEGDTMEFLDAMNIPRPT